MTTTVRAATESDIRIIADFNVRMALETEHIELDRSTVERGVARLIAAPARGYYRIAEREGVIAGSLMITSEWSDWRDGNMLWIQSVFVEPSHRRHGVFRALYQDTIDTAQADSDVRCVRLYVERDNTSAQATYTGLGMHETDYRLFEVSV